MRGFAASGACGSSLVRPFLLPALRSAPTESVAQPCRDGGGGLLPGVVAAALHAPGGLQAFEARGRLIDGPLDAAHGLVFFLCCYAILYVVRCNREGDMIAISDTALHLWFERDRAHVELRTKDTEETIIEWWDDAVQHAIEDGFLNPRNFHTSAYHYAVSVGLMR